MSENEPFPAITRALWGVLAGVAALALVARILPEPRTIDDAFITFRYSRNIVGGAGFVYNAGARTLGTTTPLYTLLMAGIGWVTGSDNYPWFALIVNALADAITAVLLALLVYRATRRISLAAVAGGVWAVNPMSVTFAVGGMETSVGILWAVTAFYLYVMRRERWMAFVAALGILTRIDTALWVGLLFLHQFVTRWRETRGVSPLMRRIPWPSWLIFVGTLAPWYVFSWAYFGTLFSRSLAAKQVAYKVDALQAFTRLAQNAATPFFEHHTLGVPGIMIGIVLYPALASVGTLFAARRYPRSVPYLLYVWVYILIFSVMNPLMFRWYLTPILPAYFLAILFGVWALVDALGTRLGRPSLVPVALSGIGVVFVLLSLNAWTLHPDHGQDRPAPDMAWNDIEINYRRIGEELRTQYGVTPETLVASGDIGAIGYYSRARILDTVGLVTPEIGHYYPFDDSLLAEGANYAVPPAIILDYRPAYVVMMKGYIANSLAADPAFAELYAVVDRIPTDYYGGEMLLYQRRDLP